MREYFKFTVNREMQLLKKCSSNFKICLGFFLLSIFFITELLSNEPPKELFDLKKLKECEEAICWSKKQTEMGGSIEEISLAKYFLGKVYSELGDWESALDWYIEAFQANPSNTLPLRDIALYYRLLGKNNLAYLFAKHGARIEEKNEEPDFQFDVELSIVSYYTQFKEEGIRACDRLILRKDTPQILKSQAYKNLLFYDTKLPDCSFIPLEFKTPLIREDCDERYHPSNPSIQKTAEGYVVICRTVNYRIEKFLRFETIDPSNIYRTKNFLLDYDNQFNLLSQKEIVENLDRKRTPFSNNEGLEDCRLFFLDDDLWFSCTTTDTNSVHPQISLCKLSSSKNLSRFEQFIPVEELLVLQGPDFPNRDEKNWLPIFKEGELSFIYSYAPFLIYKPDLRTGVCEQILYYDQVYDFSRFRGSAPPIEFDDGFLLLVHETVFFDFNRYDLHRFLKLDRNLRCTHLSRPFTFKHNGLEYCAGMTLDHSLKHLILSIGIKDFEAHFCFIDVDQIRTLLRPL